MLGELCVMVIMYLLNSRHYMWIFTTHITHTILTQLKYKKESVNAYFKNWVAFLKKNTAYTTAPILICTVKVLMENYCFKKGCYKWHQKNDNSVLFVIFSHQI